MAGLFVFSSFRVPGGSGGLARDRCARSGRRGRYCSEAWEIDSERLSPVRAALWSSSCAVTQPHDLNSEPDPSRMWSPARHDESVFIDHETEANLLSALLESLEGAGMGRDCVRPSASFRRQSNELRGAPRRALGDHFKHGCRRGGHSDLGGKTQALCADAEATRAIALPNRVPEGSSSRQPR